jgi:hypothetical protein
VVTIGAETPPAGVLMTRALEKWLPESVERENPSPAWFCVVQTA